MRSRSRPLRVPAVALAASLALVLAPVGSPAIAQAPEASASADASPADERPAAELPAERGNVPGSQAARTADAEGDAGGLTVERIFRSDDFVPETFEGTWRADGEAWTVVEQDDRDRDELWEVDAASGEREKLISASELVPEDGDEPISIYDWSFSPDGRRVLIFTDAQRVWRDRTRGRYYVFDLADRRLQPVSRKPGWQMFAKFGPDSRRVAFVRDHDIHVTEIATGEERALTTSGSDDVINGTTDWVYEEELGLRDAFRWSPDGERIAYWQLDRSPIPPFHLVDETTLYPELKPVHYPKAGTENSEVRVGSLDLESGETTWLDVGSPEYIVRMDWISDREAAVQTLNRHQDRLEVRIADTRTGDSRRVLAETDEAWVDVDDDYAWIDDGERLLWASDRDGHRHLFLFDRSGERVRQLTSGAWPVTGVHGVDEERGRVWFQAAVEHPYTRSVGWAPLEGGAPTWVAGPAAGVPCTAEGGSAGSYGVGTDGAGGAGGSAGLGGGGAADGSGADGSAGLAGGGAADGSGADDPGGVHGVQPSPDFGRIVHTCSAFSLPPLARLRTAGGEATRTLVDNAELRARLDSLDLGSHDFFTVDAADGETELNAWMIRPPEFDPAREHPLLMYVYGGPGIQTVMDAWGGTRYLWHRVMASEGFLVASVDNRGTGARGRDFYKQVHLRLGQLESDDQLAAARQLGERPEVDGGRVGIWGWSYGGYMTLMSLLESEGALSAGISVAPVTHWKLYDTIYTERYMRTPSENPEGYRKGAPQEHAAKLDAELFLVHGTGDDNVHPQHTVQMVQALEEANRQFRMRIYPNERHGIEDAADRVNLYEGMTGFLQETLGGE